MAGTDVSFMHEAIAEGERARLMAPPNPWVGCVIVRDGAVVGRGNTQPPGGVHAEVAALADAGAAARGATAFVTLMPCAHQGRTPPCSEALVGAGVARIVVALDDPDPVSESGLDHLRRAGLVVDLGVEAAVAAESLRAYLHHRTTGRPWCMLKTATSLDGRTAAADGSSQWITAPAARMDGHALRAQSQALLVGAGTALADRPSLTVRDTPAPASPPLRVVLDAAGRVPATGPLFEGDGPSTLVLTTSEAPPSAVSAWKSAGAEVAEIAPGEPGVDLEAALDLLGRRGVIQALVEGGATLHGAFVRAGLANEIVTYVGGVILGTAGAPVFEGLTVASLDDAPRWTLHDVTACGQDARLTWRPT